MYEEIIKKEEINMKLDEFIKETLVEIANGAIMADAAYKEMGRGGVNPEGNFSLEGIPHLSVKGVSEKQNRSKPIVNVQFKLNIELEEEHSAQGKVGGILNVIAASMSATKGETKKDVQEISFSIPVVLPSCGQ